MDKNIEELVKNILKNDLGQIVSDEIKKQFDPIQDQINLIRKENRASYDQISTQITQDRKDINQIKIDVAKGTTQNKVIIDNQNNQETKIVKAVEKAAENIPQNVEQSVEKLIEKKSWLRIVLDKFKKK